MTVEITDLVEDASLREVEDGFYLVCGHCDATLCPIDDGDTLGTLTRMIEVHLCHPEICPDCRHRHNPAACNGATCDCCASIRAQDAAS